jgi:DUF1009 family protein
LKAHGATVIAVAHRGETDQKLAGLVERCTWIRIGQLGKILRIFKSAGVRQAAFAGGICKPRLFGGVRPDFAALKLIARVGTGDDAMLRGAAGEIERIGIEVVSASRLLPESVPAAGALTHRRPSAEEFRDGAIGWEAARASGGLDIGQTVVVARGAVVAVEAVEGTDAAIARGGELSARKGSVVVKLAKPAQDLRVDLPAVGAHTITTMNNAGATALFLEAGKALLLDPETIIEAANRANIAIFAAAHKDDLHT